MFHWDKDKTKSIYRKMGFYSDQSGIIRRFKRETDNWENHLSKTKECILEYIESKNKKKIAILGSGWLLDVPLKELTEKFDEVWLFDIQHPRAIKDLYNEQNVNFVEADLSGYALSVYQLCIEYKRITCEIAETLIPHFSFNLEDFDVVVSCNILDQLDDLLIEFMQKKSILDGDVEHLVRTRVQQAHLNCLPRNKSIVIADTVELLVDENNNTLSQKGLIFAKTKNWSKKKDWLWKFDNYGRYRNNGNTWFKVVVFE